MLFFLLFFFHGFSNCSYAHSPGGFLVSHSPCRCLLHTLQSHVGFFFMGLQNCYTHTLRPGVRFSLAMHIFGLHSSSRCCIFKVFLFSILIFHGIFILSLFNQVLGSHSPFRCVVYTLQSHIVLFFLEKNHFYTLTLPPGFRFSLSVRIFDLHSPSRYSVFIFFFFFFSGS